MDGTGHALARHVRAIIAAGLLITVSGTGAASNENCQRLEALAREYAGVQLTSAQQQLKRRMVAWYKKNCERTRSADIRR
jgi:hypothetical protein